jgi:hypothetical protein
MKFYCGIDLSARDCHVFLLDEQQPVLVQQKLRALLSKVRRYYESRRIFGWVRQLAHRLWFPRPRLLATVTKAA